MNSKKYKPLLVAFFVTIVRYYDYSIFGFSASLLSRNFMPTNQDGSNQSLIFYAVFSIATMAKPIGSIIFGKIGDSAGRIASVKISMIIAAISTFLVAFVPTYSDIGFLAVILITLLRMMFLMSLAGEIDAIKIYVTEMIGKNNRHLVIGAVSFSSQIGVLIASFAYHITISYNNIEWLWKVNFAIGGLMGIIVILMRRWLLESELFLSMQKPKSKEQRESLIKIIASNKLKFLLATIISGFLGGGYNFLIIFLGSFISDTASIIDRLSAAKVNSILIIAYALACILSGYLADRMQARYQALIALLLNITCIIAMITSNYSIILHCLSVIFVPFYAVPCIINIQSLFPMNIRMRMVSLSHSLGSMILSSTTPFICMLIWQPTKDVSLVLSYFLFQLSLLFFALLYMIKNDYTNKVGYNELK